MKINIIKKLNCILVLFVILTIVFSSYQCFAMLNDPTMDPDFWKPTITDEKELLEKTGRMLGIINTIGIVISVVGLIAIGIKYFLGSVEEKASYKKSLVPMISFYNT